jgi:hypothetical protein
MDVLAAALQLHWAKLTSDDASSLSSTVIPLSEIRPKLRQHLQSYRLQESGAVYSVSHSDPQFWSFNGSIENALEDKDGVLLLPATSGSSYLGAAVISALGSIPDVSDLGKNISATDTSVIEDKLRDWLVSHSWGDLRATDPTSFDYQIRCILKHHPGVEKFLPTVGSNADEDAADDADADAMDDEDIASDDGNSSNNIGSTAVSTAAPAPRRPRTSRRGGASGRHSSSPSPSHYGNGSYPAGSAVQAAKQRRLHQMHQMHHRAPPTHRQRARAHKHRPSPQNSRAAPNFHETPSAVSSNMVTVSAGVLGLHLSNAATGAVNSGATKIPVGAACSQCGGSIPLDVWYRGPTLSDWQCGSCGENWSREHSCPVCGLVYDEEDDGDDLPLSLDLYKSLHIPASDDGASLLLPNQLAVSSDSTLANEQSSWIACDICGRWVMTKCDGITDLSLYDDDNPNHLPYHCPLCRGARKSIPRVFFTRQTAPLFATLLLSAQPHTSRDSVDETVKSPRPPLPAEPVAKKRQPTPKSNSIKEVASEEPTSPNNPPLSPADAPRPVSLPTASISELSTKRSDPLVRLVRAEKSLLEGWQHRRSQLDETTDLRVTKTKMDNIKLLEKRFIDDVSTLRDTLSRSLGSMLDRNKSDFDLQLSRLKKEKESLDQLAESEVTRELELYFAFKSQQLHDASEQILNFPTSNRD